MLALFKFNEAIDREREMNIRLVRLIATEACCLVGSADNSSLGWQSTTRILACHPVPKPLCLGSRADGRPLVRACSHGAGATSLDDLASEAAQHALELRGLGEKGAKARKKKALVDFLRALGSAGVSHRRSAVPQNERSVHEWFSQASLSLYWLTL